MKDWTIVTILMDCREELFGYVQTDYRNEWILVARRRDLAECISFTKGKMIQAKHTTTGAKVMTRDGTVLWETDHEPVDDITG